MPHFFKPGKTTGRIVGIADASACIAIGRSELIALPAHLMHSEGDFQFYDPVSRILFPGDLGAPIITGEAARTWVSSLAGHVPRMEAFHRRYRVSNKVLRLWAQMARRLPIDMIVPQHGAPMRGAAVQEFVAWFEVLPCGVDLLGERDYTAPALPRIDTG